MGAAANAATSKESTHLHARFLDEHTAGVFDLMSEMLLAPSLPEDEIDPEREVVLEEIAMYEDEPQDRVHDVLAQAVYGDHPLGRRVLGEAAVIAGVPARRDRRLPLRPLHGREHRGQRGRPHRSRRDRRAGAQAPEPRRRRAANGANGAAEPDPVPRLQLPRARTPSSTTSVSAATASPRSDDRRFALGVLDAIFGGSTSSRLFREIREKRGLAYAVGSYTEQYVDRGMVGDVRRHPRGERRRGLRDHRPRAAPPCATTA